MNTRHLTFIIGALLILLIAAWLRLDQLAVYPPGPHYDEAVNLLIVRSIVQGGARFFPMVEAYQGREVLYHYLAVPLIAWVHDGMFSFHALNAFASLTTIAASMALGRLLARGWRGVIIGLVIGAALALNFHQIWLGRQAFRAVTLPMMQALALAFLFRGLRAQRALWLVIAGVFAGGALYTYNASRLFPLWLAIAALALLWWDRRNWRARLQQGAAFFGTLALTAAPMLIYAVQRPDVFFGRLEEVTQPEASISLIDSVILHARMFFIQGDPYFRYNIPERPYFTLPEGALLIIGWIVCVRWLFTRRAAVTRMGALLIALSPLMVIPSVISVGGLPPSHMRSLGMIPLIIAGVAVGGAWISERIVSFVGTVHGSPVHNIRWHRYGLIPIIPLLIGAYAARDLYFTWATRVDVYYETDADLAAAAAWLRDHAAPDERLYVAARDKGHPTVEIANLSNVAWLGTDSLFTPAAGERGIAVFPRSAPPHPLFLPLIESGRIDERDLPQGPDQRAAFEAFRLATSSDTVISSVRNAYLNWVDSTAPPIPSGAAGDVMITWRIEQSPPFSDYTPLLQLEDTNGMIYTRSDAYVAGANAWRTGETLRQLLRVGVPPATPPGDYVLRAAWVGRAADTYSPYLTDTGQAGIWAEVGTLTVTRPDHPLDVNDLPITRRANTAITPDVTLIGWSLDDAPRRPGETLPITLYWRAETDAPAAFDIDLTLDDHRLATWQPLRDRYPLDQWRAGDVWAERIVPRITPAHDAGAFELALRVGERVVFSETITVAGVARLFDPPTVEEILDIDFGGEIRLHGYTVYKEFTNVSVEFVWQMLDNRSHNYKVFVHVIDAQGAILAQHDAMPLQNTYPTSLWLNGEVVVDAITLPLENGAVALRFGLYDAETGNRVLTGNDQQDFITISL